MPSLLKNGFTLIELMVTVAIIGMLAAIATPAYQGYVKRTHVLEGIQLASAVKFAVYEYYYMYSTFPANNSDIYLPMPEFIKGNAIKSIAVENGTLILTYNQRVAENATIVMVPTLVDSTIKWDCTGGTVDPTLRPYNCK
ncbi:MAG: prepilin-type N-terminal cleavage/methylation domain-containing protein [Thiothrix sp.]|nr:MAG: prepilin-type N-terminal cleavage/methylation domain-containing protein [Thiothrix sp.]